MRTLLVLAALAALPRLALAADKKCYAGTETIDGVAHAIVVLRELDRDAHAIRQHVWRETNPTHEAATTIHVADDGKTFTVEHGPMKGTGTFEGEPWKWTAFHEHASALGGTLTADGTVAGDAMHVQSTIEMPSGSKLHEAVEAKAFDCAELDKRRAALDDTAKDAVRVCFEGTEKLLTAEEQHVVVEQIFEPERIQLLVSSRKRDARFVLAIDGSSITVTNGKSWTGSGLLAGKPGAWTGYRYTARIGDLDSSIEGTLGGSHAHQTMTMHSKRHDVTGQLDADAFDCKDLAARRAALDAAAP